MASVTICSDFGAPQNKVWHCFHGKEGYRQDWSTQRSGNKAALRVAVGLPWDPSAFPTTLPLVRFLLHLHVQLPIPGTPVSRGDWTLDSSHPLGVLCLGFTSFSSFPLSASPLAAYYSVVCDMSPLTLSTPTPSVPPAQPIYISMPLLSRIPLCFVHLVNYSSLKAQVEHSLSPQPFLSILQVKTTSPS